MPIPPTETARKLRQRAEEKSALIETTNAEKLSPEDIRGLLHELQVYQAELEMQNDELRSVIAEKGAIQDLYIDLYENAPAGYFNLDRDAKIHAVNTTGADLLGVERALLIKNRLDAFISDETRPTFHDFLDKVFTSNTKETCEVAFETERLPTIFVQINASVTESGGNCRAVITDITRRIESEKELKIAREELQRYSGETDAIISSMLDAVLVYDVDMNVVRVNPGFLSVYGFDPIGMNVREIIVKTHCRNYDGTPLFFDQQPTPRALMGEKVLNQLFIITRLDGQERILETSSSPMCIGEQITGSVTVWHDITERKQAEKALIESKQKIQSIIDNTSAIVYAFDLEERFVLANSTVAKLLNSTSDQMIGKRRHHFMHQADADWHEANDRKVIEAGEALDFEEQSELPGRSITWLTTKFPLRDAAGKIYAVGGISTDITERKRTEEALRESQERLTLAADAGQVGMFDLNMVNGDLQWTQQHEIIFGYEPTTTTTTTTRTYRDWADRVHPEDLPMVEGRMSQSMEERAPFQLEYRLVWPDNSLHWVNVTSKYYFDDSGRCTRLLGAVRDITNQKLAEEALRQSEERFRSMFEQAPLGVAIVDSLNGRFYVLNPAFARITGWPVEDLERIDWVKITHPDDIQADLDQMAAMNAGKTDGFQMEKRYRRPDGSCFWVNITVAPMYVTDATHPRHLLMVEDVDARKQAEEALSKNEKRLSDIYASMSEGMALHEIVYEDTGQAVDYFIIDANPAFESITGLERSSAIGKKASELYGTGEAPYLDTYAKVASTGESTSFEVHFAPLNKHFHISVFSPEKGKFATIFQDITERKRTEEALRDSEQQFSVLIQNLKSAVALIDESGEFTIVNRAFLRIFELNDDSSILNVNEHDWSQWEVFDENGLLLDVDDHPVRKAALTGSSVRDKLVAVKAPEGGELKWLLVSAEPTLDAQGQIHRLICTYHDITARKLAEDALRESENRFRLLAETMLQGVVHQDAHGKIISMNPAAERILGKSLEDFIGNTSVSLEHDTIRENGELFPGMVHPTMVALQTGQPVRGVVMGVFNPKLKEYRWIGIDAVPVFRPGEDRPSEVYSVFGDITDRKNVEKTLQESEQRIQQALQVSRSFTFEWLPVTDQVMRSESCAVILKHTHDDAFNDTGEHFFLCVHPEDRARFGQILRDLTPINNSYITEYRYVSKDGSEITLEETEQAFFDADGKMQRLVGVTTDITLRKQAEKALQRAHEELEQRVAERTKELAVTIDQLQSEIRERELTQKKLLEETAERLQATEALREKERMLIQQSRITRP